MRSNHVIQIQVTSGGTVVTVAELDLTEAEKRCIPLHESGHTVIPRPRLVFLRLLMPDAIGFQNGTFGTPENSSGILESPKFSTATNLWHPQRLAIGNFSPGGYGL